MDERALTEELFPNIFLADFPQHRDAMAKLLPLAVRAVADGKMREFERACAGFLADGPMRWPRYDAHLSYWGEADPRLPEIEDGEVVADGDFREAGELLAHRVTMAVLQERRRRQYLAETDAFPFWRLRVIEDGRAYPDCVEASKTARHFTDPYWQSKALPCARLFCRCLISRAEREGA
ncbi:hypothetical protein TMEC54S_03499 [Thauera mechernichensis]